MPFKAACKAWPPMLFKQVWNFTLTSCGNTLLCDSQNLPALNIEATFTLGRLWTLQSLKATLRTVDWLWFLLLQRRGSMHIKEHNLALWTEKLLIIKLTHRHRSEYSVPYSGSRGITSMTLYPHIYSLHSVLSAQTQFPCNQKGRNVN